mmetsp:Transcript_3237/g.5661  ORF Transcript_3237/g.5661 Transcript_3237/m.5661 type:complete len:176 (-) Transcript_3237:413-940(-)
MEKWIFSIGALILQSGGALGGIRVNAFVVSPHFRVAALRAESRRQESGPFGSDKSKHTVAVPQWPMSGPAAKQPWGMILRLCMSLGIDMRLVFISPKSPKSPSNLREWTDWTPQHSPIWEQRGFCRRISVNTEVAFCYGSGLQSLSQGELFGVNKKQLLPALSEILPYQFHESTS